MTTATASVAPHRDTSTTRTFAIPWYVTAVLIASTSAVVGVIWDISWHSTIGRDTFWTPAHLAIYFGGAVSGLACGWLVLRTTFAGSADARAAGVRFWGFRGPLGAWVCIWGAIAMITSAPFDDWWHNAYGLDVQILSPPHVVLALGIFGIQLGALLMVLAEQNRAGPAQWGVRVVYAYATGLLVITAAIITSEYIGRPNLWHRSLFYQITGAILPVYLVATARASTLRWPATAAAAVYMSISMLMIWVLQLFPAQPLLGPIYNPVTHMVPMPFPLLLLGPAVAVDVLMRGRGAEVSARRDWVWSPLLGVSFVAVMLAIHWVFADFLLSPAARNFFFAADQWPYAVQLGDWRYEYWGGDASPASLARGLALAVLFAAGSARLGLWWGGWMQRVKR